MIGRLREVADLFAQHGLSLAMETGQEAASELLQFLNDVARANVVVNFDPANMLLYGAGNPVDAVRVLGRHVQHVHIKDAICSNQPGTRWGEEVAFGKGQVNAQAFLTTLRSGGYRGPLVIEREAAPPGWPTSSTRSECWKRCFGPGPRPTANSLRLRQTAYDTFAGCALCGASLYATGREGISRSDQRRRDPGRFAWPTTAPLTTISRRSRNRHQALWRLERGLSLGDSCECLGRGAVHRRSPARIRWRSVHRDTAGAGRGAL